MAQVHPSSIIGPHVELADDVVVGPWCCLEGRITIGPGTRLLRGVNLKGPLTIGARNLIYPHACIGYEPQDLKYDPAIDGAGTVIGDANTFREGVTISRATGAAPTSVGDANYLMAYSHLGHDVSLGSNCLLANGAGVAGHVKIGDRVVLGGGAMIHQFCRVGRMSMVSGLGGLAQDLPPFCMVHRSRRVSGLNLVGLRRGGFKDNVDAVRQAFKILFRSNHTLSRAVERIQTELAHDPLCQELAAFVQGTKRGITPYGSSRMMDEDEAED